MSPTTRGAQKILKDFDAPVCHLDKIIKRFVSNRIHFWANFISSNMKVVNEDNIEEASYASKTARRSEIIKS